MKTLLPIRFSLLLALFGGLPFGALAQERSTSDSPPSAPTVPAEPATPVTPESAPMQAPAAPVPEPELRRLDEPTPTEAPRRRPARTGNSEVPFGDHVVSSGATTREVVSVFGSSTVEGEVSRDVVSIFGTTRIGPNARVGGAAVAVLGRLEVDGPVGGEAVSVLGGSRINSHVRGEAVAVLGNLELGPNAIVDGDVVVVGGRLIKDPGAVLRGDEVNVPALAGFGEMEWLATWFKRCLLMGRPLAFGENLGWAWVVAFSFLGLYLLLALIFPRGIDKCALTLETRPGYSILSAILTVLLTPVAIVLLAITVVGVLLVPLLGAGLFFAGLFGKAVMLAWTGRRITRLFGDGPFMHPTLAVLLGGLVVLLLYTIPVFGLMLYKLLSWLGVGVVVYTIALGLQRDKPKGLPPAIPAVPSPLPSAPMPMPARAAVAAPEPTFEQPAILHGVAPGAASVSNFTSPGVSSTPVMEAPSPAPESPPPGPLSAATFPRAGLGVRLGALLVDLILVAVVLGFSEGLLPRFMRFDSGPPTILPLIAIYGAVMWKTKGTTIGGIIFGLKVVRVDGREMDWPTAVVRALSCFLSLIVAGLGFLWVAIDEERQSWHDKIAGTAVVRVPKGVALL